MRLAVLALALAQPSCGASTGNVVGRTRSGFALLRVAKARASATVIDTQGAIFVGGLADRTRFGAFKIGPASCSNCAFGFVGKFDRRGRVVWVRQTREVQGWIRRSRGPLVALSGGNLFVALLTVSDFAAHDAIPASWPPGPSDSRMASCESRARPLVASFSGDGELRWNQPFPLRARTPFAFRPRALEADNSGGVFLIGESHRGGAVSRIDGDGRVLWWRSFDDNSANKPCETKPGPVSMHAAATTATGDLVFAFYSSRDLVIGGDDARADAAAASPRQGIFESLGKAPADYLAKISRDGELLWIRPLGDFVVRRGADRSQGGWRLVPMQMESGPGDRIYIGNNEAVAAFSAASGEFEGEIYRSEQSEVEIRRFAVSATGTVAVAVHQDAHGVRRYGEVAVRTSRQIPTSNAVVIVEVAGAGQKGRVPIVLRSKPLAAEGFDFSVLGIGDLQYAGAGLTVVGGFDGTLMTGRHSLSVPYGYKNLCTHEDHYDKSGCDHIPYSHPSMFIANFD